RNTLTSLTNLLPDWKGPAAKDRVLLTDAGQGVIDGFIRGLESRYGAVRRSLRNLTHEVAGTDMGTIDAPRIAAPSMAGLGRAGLAAGGAGALPPIHVHALMDGPEVGRRVLAAIREWERQNGMGR